MPTGHGGLRTVPLLLPVTEAGDESGVGLDAGALFADVGVGLVIGHAVLGYQVGDDDGGGAGDALLAVDEDVEAASEGGGDGVTRAVEVRLEVCGGEVEDVHAVDVELEALEGRVREPGCVEDLDEEGDAVLFEQGGVHGRAQGAEIEGAGAVSAGVRGKDFVHGCAHGGHDLRGHLVEANHGVEEVVRGMYTGGGGRRGGGGGGKAEGCVDE